MRILGLSAFERGSAAALLVDGRCVAAAEEERFTRRPGDASFPVRAARSCLASAGLAPKDLDRVVFHEKPLRRFERLLAQQLQAFPRSAGVFARTMFLWLGDRMWTKNRIASELGVEPARLRFTSHHLSHAASAFLPSPFDEAAVLVVDGAGEWATTTLARGSQGALELLAETRFPHSLALFSAALAQYLGFEPFADEHKLQALASFGDARRASAVRELVALHEDGSFALDMAPFRFAWDGELLFDDELARRLGPRRIQGGELAWSGSERAHADVAAGAQAAVADALLHVAAELHRRVPSRNLCVAGSLALDAHAMTELARRGPFDELWIQPAADDAGAALGAALYVHAREHGGERAWRQEELALGEPPAADPGPEAVALAGDEEVVARLAGVLRAGGIAGWVRGRFEWGPRALGHRSLLASPLTAGIRAELDRRAAPREPFLPYGLAVASERASELCALPRGGLWPLRFGQVLVEVAGDWRERLAPALLGDGRARVRLVERERDPLFHRLLEEVGTPALLEEPLAPRGEPPVRGEAEARAFFERSAVDLVVVDARAYERAGVAATSGAARRSRG